MNHRCKDDLDESSLNWFMQLICQSYNVKYVCLTLLNRIPFFYINKRVIDFLDSNVIFVEIYWTKEKYMFDKCFKYWHKMTADWYAVCWP